MSICENLSKIKQIAKAVKNLKEPILKLVETGNYTEAKELYEKLDKAYPDLKKIDKLSNGVSIILHNGQAKLAKTLEKIKKGTRVIPKLKDKKEQRIITDLVIEGEIKVRF